MSKSSDFRKRMTRRMVTDDEALAAEREAQREQREKRVAGKVIKALEKELEEHQVRQDFIDRLALAPDPSPYKIKSSGKGKHPQATYVMLASDWHVGERVRPENVRGKNEYSPEIAEERAEQFWKSQLIMLESARSAWEVKHGILWLGGDLMTGYIHEEYEEENFLSPVEESLLAFQIISRGIETLLAKSDLEKIVIPTSCGNHGRTGKKIRIATYAKNSFEWLLYQHLRMRFEEEPRLEFRIATSYHNVVDVYGYRISFSHGDAIRYQGGVGGITIPMNRRIGREAQSVPVRWEGTELGIPHLYVQGHYHQLMFPGPFIQNGSLIGWNDFAEWIGAPYEDPRQCSFVVDERYRVVSNFNPILVTKPRK